MGRSREGRDGFPAPKGSAPTRARAGGFLAPQGRRGGPFSSVPGWEERGARPGPARLCPGGTSQGWRTLWTRPPTTPIKHPEAGGPRGNGDRRSWPSGPASPGALRARTIRAAGLDAGIPLGKLCGGRRSKWFLKEVSRVWGPPPDGRGRRPSGEGAGGVGGPSGSQGGEPGSAPAGISRGGTLPPSLRRGGRGGPAGPGRGPGGPRGRGPNPGYGGRRGPPGPHGPSAAGTRAPGPRVPPRLEGFGPILPGRKAASSPGGRRGGASVRTIISRVWPFGKPSGVGPKRGRPGFGTPLPPVPKQESRAHRQIS